MSRRKKKKWHWETNRDRLTGEMLGEPGGWQ
jgi:hypothetical protein